MANNAVKTIINCGTTQISASVFSESAGMLVLESLSVENLIYDYTAESEWESAISIALGKILATLKPRGEIVVIAPGQMLLTKNVKVPQVEKARQKQIISFEAQNSFPFPLDELVWDSQVISSDGVEEEVVLFALKKRNAIRFTNLMRASGITPHTIQPATNLDVQAYKYVTRSAPETDPILIVNVGAHTTNLTFISENGFGINNVSIGGNYVTQKLAESTGVPFQAAEQRKLAFFRGTAQFAQADPVVKTINDAADAFMRRLSQEITRRVINFKRTNNNVGPKKILVSGRGALLPGFVEKLSELQKMPVEHLDLAQDITLSGAVSPETFEETKFELQESIGEAARLVLTDIDAVNLLPQEIAQEIEFKKKTPFFIAAGILFAIAPWPVWAHLCDSGKQIAREISVQKTTIKDYNDRQQKIEDLEKKNAALRASVEKLNSSLDDRFAWNNYLASLHACVLQLQQPDTVDEDGEKTFRDDRHVWLDKMDVIEQLVPAKEASGGEPAVPAHVVSSVTLRFSMLIPEIDALHPKHNPEIFERRMHAIEDIIKKSSLVESDSVTTASDFSKANVPALTVQFRLKPGKGI